MNRLHQNILLVDNFVTKDRCNELMGLSNEYISAPVTTHNGPVMMTEKRNNDRAIFTNFDLAKSLYIEALPYIKEMEQLGFEPCGLNEMFRIYRYTVGQQFNWHRDGIYKRTENGERSLLTFMIYLNEGCEGGQTEFRDEKVNIQPKTGSLLLFTHAIVHRGAPIISGIKHVLRSDVMFNPLNI